MKLQFKGAKFFLLVVLVYLVLFFINSERTAAALEEGILILLKLIPVFLALIVLTAVINYFLNPQQIVKYFGKKSGKMGWFYALIGGIVSHGPMYAWYPMLEDMKRHGLRDGLIATFFYARAVKLPLLPLMIDYFGLIFTSVLSVYILVGAYLQGTLIEYLLSLKQKNQSEHK
jgi:uncharacterized membrane protein YraQ (UPF0718 family)